MTLCKNCGHEIYKFGDKWYHLRGSINKTVCVPKYPAIELILDTQCFYQDEIICKACENITRSEPCKCKKPEPKGD